MDGYKNMKELISNYSGCWYEEENGHLKACIFGEMHHNIASEGEFILMMRNTLNRDRWKTLDGPVVFYKDFCFEMPGRTIIERGIKIREYKNGNLLLLLADGETYVLRKSSGFLFEYDHPGVKS